MNNFESNFVSKFWFEVHNQFTPFIMLIEGLQYSYMSVKDIITRLHCGFLCRKQQFQQFHLLPQQDTNYVYCSNKIALKHAI